MLSRRCTTARGHAGPRAWVLAALSLAGLSAALAQGQTPRPPSLPAGPGAAPPAAASPGLLADAARVIGLSKCRPVLERLAPMVSQDSIAQDLILDRDKAAQGEAPVFLLLGMQRQVGTAALSIAAVPESDGSCSFAAERISMAPFTCESVARAELPGYRATKLLETFTVYTDPKDPGATVVMLDSAPGCIIIRRHVQFRWRPQQ